MNQLRLTLWLSLFFSVPLVHAAPQSNVPTTNAMLPPYCKDSVDQKAVGYQEWVNKLGPDFVHVRHYCAGLYTMAVGVKLFDKSKREEAFNNAIQEMDYVLRYASADFALLPKISYDIGQLYEKLDKTDDAIKAYQYSIKLNPKLPIPYAALSDLFKKQKDTKAAVSILEQGLKYKPDSKALLKRMASLSK